MLETMDIWNAMSEEIGSPVGPCGIGSNPYVLHLNRTLRHEKSKSITTFLDEYLSKYDLAHLYALNAACFAVIESTVPLIILDLYESEDDFCEIVESELSYFSEIESIVNVQELIHELWQVANGEYWSDGKLNTPENMKKLGRLSFDLQKWIENSSWDFSEMTHAYMCSLTLGNYRRFDYESFTYQISREIQCDDAINNFIPYLQKDASGRGDLIAERYCYEAEVLRLIQWAEIGNISEYVRDFCKTITINHPQTVGNDFHDRKYIKTPFALFRSDLALDYLKDQLSKYLFDCQVWLQNTSQRNEYSDDPVFHVAKMAISAIYLFGAYRLNVNDYDKDLLEHAASYLQTHQLPDGSFIIKASHLWVSLEMNAMVIHSLWISEAFGWERTNQRAFDWIIGQLDIYGVWYEFRFCRTGYLTGLLLDAIELIEEGENITFSIPQNKKKKPETTAHHSKGPSVVNLIVKGDINNIFGNTIQYGSSKSKSKNKNKLESKTNDDMAKSTGFVEWKKQDKAYFIIDRQQNLFFEYKGHEKKQLKTKLTDRLSKLILLFCDKKDTIVDASAIWEYFEHKDKAHKIVPSVNISLNHLIKKIGLCDWTGNVEFIKRQTRGKYYAVVPVVSIDKYEHDCLVDSEESFYNPNENKDDEHIK